jgi:polyphosphate kinase
MIAMLGITEEAPRQFINRELSSLAFNQRVLEEAQDKDNPLLERAKFAAIVSSNLDEFFMVRVSAVWDQLLAGLNEPDEAGLTPQQVWEQVSTQVHHMIGELYSCYGRSLRPSLKRENIQLTKGKKLNLSQKEFLENYFHKNIYPVLTPMVVDNSRPFPLLLNRSLNIALLLANQENEGEPVFATVQVPAVLDRLVAVPAEDSIICLVFLEEIIKNHIHTLFAGHRILTMGCYRITRNADLSWDEEGAEDLLEAIEQSIKQRKWGEVVRLEYEKGLNTLLQKRLIEELEVAEGGVYEINGPLDLTCLFRVGALQEMEHLRYPMLRPQLSSVFKVDEDYFSVISSRDIMVHHPYESFQPVVELVQKAAEDPQVLAIKQVLYRVSGNSPIIAALAQAAENGKQVTVLLELKARFDEENNITWAKRLEKAGCHVIYGIKGLKTHAKVLLIVRDEDDGIKRYVHMGTGNYNDVTAKLYVDLGLFTCNAYMGADASALFNMLSGYSNLGQLYKLAVAPMTLRQKLMLLLQQEIEHARKGRKAHVIIKVNSLLDQGIIEELYEASCAGVEIDLIIRGICCLKPDIPGMSENIRVRSIVGRFLEHSRIFYFYNDGEKVIYLSSADLMPRNLDRRIELLFPVEDENNKSRLISILDAYLKDTVKAEFSRTTVHIAELIKGANPSLTARITFIKLPYNRNRLTFSPLTRGLVVIAAGKLNLILDVSGI